MIQCISRQPNRYFAYDMLMDEVWQRRCSDAAIRTLVKRLRQSLADADMASLGTSIHVRGRSLGLFLGPSAP
jgi:DNA-binding response OmpR family regulator